MKIAKEIANTLFKGACWSENDSAWTVDDSFYKEDVYNAIDTKLEIVKRTFEMILESTTEEPFTLETRLDMCANLSRDILALFKE